MSAPSTSVRGPTQSESLVGVISGSGRALASQIFSFYIRVPVKLFRPARVDYAWMLRKSLGINKVAYNSWSDSTLCLLWQAIKKHGLRFVPDRLLPPMVANSVVGAVLYTSYLSSLSIAQFAKGNEYPTLGQALFAGAFAGASQAAVATPLDNLEMRFDAEILKDQDMSLWKYSRDTLWKIGPRAAYGGILLNVVKEASSFSLFFGTFETIKGPMYRHYRDWWQSPGYFHPEGRPKSRILFPTFILLAGSAAACALQLVNYPLSKVQRVLSLRLQAIDASHKQRKGLVNLVDQGWRYYAQVYYKTFHQVKGLISTEAHGSTLKWLYSGSLRYTLVSMPSTSIGLLVFEIFRIRYATDTEMTFH